MNVWQSSPLPPALRPDELHLWRLSLEAPLGTGAGQDEVLSLLDVAERARASRIRSPRDRRRWALSRGWLRCLLGAYLEVPPEEIELIPGPTGKPSARTPGGKGVRFNLSHADDLVLVGVSDAFEVGVDVERIRGDLDLLGIARLALSATEVRELEGLDGRRRAKHFAELWVGAEARRKCLGIGFRAELPTHGTLPRVHPFEIGEGFAAAWASCDDPVSIRYLEGVRFLPRSLGS